MQLTTPRTFLSAAALISVFGGLGPAFALRASAWQREPLPAGAVTLNTLLDEGLLTGADSSLRLTPPRIAAATPGARAVLGYLSGNCGACHNGDGRNSANLPSFAYAGVMDGNAVIRQLVDRPSRWQAPGQSENTRLIDTTSPQASAVLLRMSSRRPSSQMPPLGTVMKDQAAIDAIGRWMSSGPVVR